MKCSLGARTDCSFDNCHLGVDQLWKRATHALLPAAHSALLASKASTINLKLYKHLCKMHQVDFADKVECNEDEPTRRFRWYQND